MVSEDGQVLFSLEDIDANAVHISPSEVLCFSLIYSSVCSLCMKKDNWQQIKIVERRWTEIRKKGSD